MNKAQLKFWLSKRETIFKFWLITIMYLEKIRIELRQQRAFAGTLQRIDENHANPLKKWCELGKPQYIKQPEIDLLRKSSRLQKEKLHIKDGSLSLVVSPHSCIFVEIPNYFA